MSPIPGSVLKIVLIRFFAAFLILGLMFFLPAGTFNYWQAWVYLLVLLIPMVFLFRYLYKNDPKLLERRTRTRETRKTQRAIVAVSVIFFLAAFVIPGFDHRMHWSNVPAVLVVISDGMVLFGYLIVAEVFKANTYTSRIVEVEKGQKVISTGPYSRVRHPMYLGVIIYYLFSPVALGSFWAVIPMLHIIPLLVIRILDEEKELLENLKGYREYTGKTRYRLLPKIW